MPDLDYVKIAKESSKNRPSYNPEAFTGNLDLSSNYLEGETISPSLLTDYYADSKLNEIKAQNQDWIDTIANNTGAALIKTGGNLIGGVGYLVGLGNGVTKAIGRGIDENEDFKFDRNDFFENPMIHLNEKIDEFVEKELPNYQTRDEQDNPLALRNFFGTVASTTTRDALPFMAAFMLEGMGLAKVMGSYAKAAKLEQLAAKGGEGIKEMGKVQNMVKKFWQTADQNTIRELMITQESLIEAHHGSDRIKEENYKRLYDEGITRGMSEQEANEIAETKSEELANIGAGAIFSLNQGILRLGNIEMKTLFKPAMGSRRPYEALRKSWDELQGIKDKSLFIGKKVFNTEVAKEAAEEVLQGAGGEAVLEKTKELKADEQFTFGDFLTSGINTLTGAVKRLGTNEGILEALSSIVLTGGASIINRKRDSQDIRLKDELRREVLNSDVSEEYKKNITDLTTTTESGETIVSDLGSTLINQARTNLELNVLSDAAEATGNSSLYTIVKNQQLANLAYKHFEFGLGEDFENKIDEIAKQEAKKLKEQGKTKIYDYESGREITIEEYSANIKNKIKSFENIYNSLETNYGITNDALRNVIFNNSIQQNELVKRINNYKPILGEEWFNHLKEVNKEESVYLKELQTRKKELNRIKVDRLLTKEELEEAVNIDTLMNLYDSYQLAESKLSNPEQLDNQKRYKDKSTDIAFLNKLKKDFNKAITPETQSEIINDKVVRDELASSVDDLPTTQKDVPVQEEVITPIEEVQEKAIVTPIIDKQEDITEDMISKDISFEDLPGVEKKEELLEDNITNQLQLVEQNDSIEEDKLKKIYESNFVTNSFEQVNSKGLVEIDNKTKETLFTEQGKVANEELLKLKKGDTVDVVVGFMNPKDKNSDLLTLEEFRNNYKRNPTINDFTIRAFSNNVRLGGVKITEDGIAVFNNIVDNNINQLLKTKIPIISYNDGFIRKLFNTSPKTRYKSNDIPFENRAYVNKPSDVVGDISNVVIVTANNEGTVKYLTRNQSLSIDKGKLKPGVPYLLIRHPSSGKVYPLETLVNYISPEVAAYIKEKVEKAVSDKDEDLVNIIRSITPHIYYDEEKGLYISKGKVFIKGKQISLKDLEKTLINTYSAINDTMSLEQLDEKIRLNVPKDVHFIFPKIVLDLTAFKNKDLVKSESVSQENNSTETADTSKNITIFGQTTTKEKLLELSKQQDIPSINEEGLISENDSNNIINEESTKEELIKNKTILLDYLLSRGTKEEKELLLTKDNKIDIKKLNNINPEMIEHFIKCLQ